MSNFNKPSQSELDKLRHNISRYRLIGMSVVVMALIGLILLVLFYGDNK